MKQNFRRILSVLILVLFCFSATPIFAQEEDDTYYIKNLDVQVQVNSKREYEITETIDVHFNERKHGIVRNIPTSNSAESYQITDVSVVGAPSSILESGDAVSVKIGDPDKKVKGDVRYVVRYKRICYADYLIDGDYIYFDAIGAEWDTYAQQVRAEITYPDTAQLEEVTLTSGEHGSTENQFAEYQAEENRIVVSSTERVGAGEAITAMVKLKEGAFADAPKYEPPYLVTSSDTTVTVDKSKNYHVERSFVFDFKDGYSGLALPLIPTQEDIDANPRFSNLVINGEPSKLSSGKDYVVVPEQSGEFEYKISYDVYVPLKSAMLFSFAMEELDTKTAQMTTQIKLPFKPKNYHVDFGRLDDKLDETRYTQTYENKVLTISAENVQPGERLDVMLTMPANRFSRALSFGLWVTIMSAGIVLLMVIAFYVKFGRDTPLAPPIAVYPPRKLSSAEIGYVINQTANAGDITSLIFYWASKGYLSILMHEDEEYDLIKKKDLDDSHPQYEQKLFRALFRKGDVVDKKSLSGKFSKHVVSSQTALPSLFRGERSLSDSKASAVQKIAFILSFIPLLILGIGSAVENNIDLIGGLLYGAISALGVIIAFVFLWLTQRHFYKMRTSSRVLSISFTVIYLIAAVGMTLYFYTKLGIPLWLTIAVTLLSYVSMMITIFVTRRSAYGTEILEEVLGFRNFIEVAEKERLEALLDEDPNYFYDTLPYAQVLNVTEIWNDKFKDLVLSPPEWYQYDDPQRMGRWSTYWMLHSMRQITQDSLPVVETDSTNQNSFGGGGGFSGGGFSGGGGGGGGSSW